MCSGLEVVVAEEELPLLELDEEELEALEVAELEEAELVLDLGPTSDLMVKRGVKLTSVVLSSLIWKA